MMCQCNCEKPGNHGYIENAKQCNLLHGTLKCGRYLLAGCRPDNTTSILCNNRGDCICGKCECHSSRDNENNKVFGDFCECDNFSCDRHNNLLCSGPDHGECYCGKCICAREWNVTGYTACECSSSKDTCVTPYGEFIDKECSGHGHCICGKCRCNENSQYSGTYCEVCPLCPDKCDELKPR
ncbi:ITGB1 [Lepeophtheirus salmonis]|uniref:ITGB1 n=1 Tax=Lepeophtheirus salmonis TaxID=72036 RepID=A0A7R8CLC8_LEPSM|nr:ITGB1 [Lepeophtheirus salmonis]CAF2852918.1 ITGB1 [Lepeophtheirus salmonis]